MTSLDSPPPVVRTGSRVPGAGGVLLATDVYRPPDKEPVPVALIRSYTGKADHVDEALGWVRHGFACVVQDVRGRFDSDGEWSPYRHERGDGKAVAVWLADQPWTDGRIVAVGASYNAFTAWATAIEAPDVVRAVISLVPAMGLNRVKFDRSGILLLAEHASWWLTYGETRTSRKRLCEAMFRAVPNMLEHLPICDLPERFWAELHHWTAVIAAGPDHQLPDAVTDDELRQLAAPTLHIGGWHDGLLCETLHQWETAGAAVSPRPHRSLLIGPWTHNLGLDGSTSVQERDYGPDSRLALGRIQVTWAHQALGSDPPRGDGEAQYFVMGANRWMISDTWPPPLAARFHLYAARDAELSVTPPAKDGLDSFVYDPLDPFPWRPLPAHRPDLDARRDAVRYTSAVHTVPLEIAGKPVVVLYASTDAPHTDWVVRLLEATTSGQFLPVSQGCVDTERAGHRSGQITRYEIELDALALTIPAGHRIRLEITSSDFPGHARNLNTGDDRYTTTARAIAHQSVHYGPCQPTAVILPLITPTPSAAPTADSQPGA